MHLPLQKISSFYTAAAYSLSRPNGLIINKVAAEDFIDYNQDALSRLLLLFVGGGGSYWWLYLQQIAIVMKRDMDLVRDILLAVEARTDAYDDSPTRIEGRSTYEVDYHVSMLVEAGLISGLAISSKEHPAGSYLVSKLTWDGHEFLDSARRDEDWDRAKRIAKEKGGALTFETMKATLSALAIEAIRIAVRATNN